MIQQKDQQDQLQQLICNRIDDLSYVGNHMIAPGDEAVEKIGDLHHGEQKGRIKIISHSVCVKISIRKIRDQCDTDIAEKIRNRNELFELHTSTSQS